jgi:hypothetical protein
VYKNMLFRYVDNRSIIIKNIFLSVPPKFGGFFGLSDSYYRRLLKTRRNLRKIVTILSRLEEISEKANF